LQTQQLTKEINNKYRMLCYKINEQLKLHRVRDEGICERSRPVILIQSNNRQSSKKITAKAVLNTTMKIIYHLFNNELMQN
jgi:hypothetical protein